MPEKLAYSVKETADILGLSQWKIRRMCDTKEIRSLKAGSWRIIPAAAVTDFLAQSSADHTAE